MAKMQDNKIMIQDEDGNEHLIEVIFTYENEHRNKKYVFFLNPTNEDEVIVMSYDDNGELNEIDDEEFKEAEEVLSAFEDERLQEDN